MCVQHSYRGDMSRDAFPRGGRGVTTSTRLYDKQKGPLCSICKYNVEVATRDANGNLVCPECRPEKFAGIVEVLPRGREAST